MIGIWQRKLSIHAVFSQICAICYLQMRLFYFVILSWLDDDIITHKKLEPFPLSFPRFLSLPVFQDVQSSKKK